MNLRTLARRTFAALSLTIAAAALPGSAAAQSQSDLVTPTPWLFYTAVPFSTVEAQAANGYRVVDIEVEDDSPLRVSAVLVRNSGEYGKGWWWYFGVTALEISQLTSQNNARLIDIEPYMTSGGLRYAVVMIPNNGADFSAVHGFQTDRTFSQVVSWLNANPSLRILDIQPYRSGITTRYAFTYVQNAGALASPFWLQMNTTPQVIADTLNQNDARIIDLEIHEDTDRVTALMVPNDGNLWYWFYGMTFSQADQVATQHACRLIDYQQYRTSSGETRYAAVLRRNNGDLAVDAVTAMRAEVDFDATVGVLMRRLDGTPTTIAGNEQHKVFEPAALMKTVHHFAAMRDVAVDHTTLSSPMIENVGSLETCPNGTNPEVRSLGTVLRDMMEASSSSATEAVRERYGASFIQAVAAGFGATNVALNHTLGCFCGSTRNEITLSDLADLHQSVVAGSMGESRDDFYDLMTNRTDFGMGIYDTAALLTAELDASSLSPSERGAFASGLRVAQKGGSYTCVTFTGRKDHRSRGGYLRLPFRSGCSTVFREYFIGSWVNDATSSSSAENAVGVAIYTLYRDRLRAAIASWEAASCSDPFLNYCQANPNSTGAIGIATASGSAFVANNSLRIDASQLPANTFGFLLVAPSPAFVPSPGGSSGVLCLGGPIGRYQNAIMNSGATGEMSLQIDLGAIPRPSGSPTAVQGGDTLYFQWWHRDVAPNGSTTSNFTNGVRTTFI